MTGHHYLAAICLAHIAMGLTNPPAGLPSTATTALGNLQTAASAPVRLGPSGYYDRLPVPLHHLHPPRDSVLWAALTIGHYGLF